MRLVSVVLPAEFLDALEDLVRLGRWPNRSAAVREAVRRLLEEERGFLTCPRCGGALRLARVPRASHARGRVTEHDLVVACPRCRVCITAEGLPDDHVVLRLATPEDIARMFG